mmetsp:Transcript_64683/g.140905  ORF Transcript_64683/g.140905 Transcript_64683/m.140905 type:complete len:1473 (-) Transcript_64683:104-4522(-)
MAGLVAFLLLLIQALFTQLLFKVAAGIAVTERQFLAFRVNQSGTGSGVAPGNSEGNRTIVIGALVSKGTTELDTSTVTIAAYGQFLAWLTSERQPPGLYVNGESFDVELVVIDDEGDKAELAMAHLTDVIGARFVLGLGSGDPAKSAEVARSRGAVVVTPSQTDSSAFKIPPTVFSMSIQFEFYADAFVQVVRDATLLEEGRISVNSVGYFREMNDFGKSLSKVVVESFASFDPSGGLTIFGRDLDVDASNDDMHTAVKWMKARSPDVVVGALLTSPCTRLLRVFQEERMYSKIVIMPTCLLDDYYLDIVGDAVYFVLGTGPARRGQAVSRSTGWTAVDLDRRMRSSTTSTVHWSAVLAARYFATIETLVLAIEKVGTQPSEVAAALATMDDYGMLGRIAFQEQGQLQGEVGFWQHRPDFRLQGQRAPFTANSSCGLVLPMPLWEDYPCLNPGDMPGNVGFSGNNSDNLQCTNCSKGRVGLLRDLPEGGDSTCRPSIPKLYCEDCPAGQEGPRAAGRCSNCTAGRFSDEPGVASCSPCIQGLFQASEGQSTCGLCTPGKFMRSIDSSACDPCVPVGGTVRYQSRYGSERCDPCPRGAQCLIKDNSSLYLDYVSAPGFYLMSNVIDATSPLGKLYRCPHEEGKVCLGGNLCLEGNEGPLCGKCSKGFARQHYMEKCEACKGKQGYLVLNALILGLAGVLYTGMSAFFNPLRFTQTFLVLFMQLFSYCSIMVVCLEALKIKVTSDSMAEDLLAPIFVLMAVQAPQNADLAADCLAQQLFPTIATFKVYVVVGFLLVPAAAVVDALLFYVARRLVLAYCRYTLQAKYLVTLVIAHTFLLHTRIMRLFLMSFDCTRQDTNRLLWSTDIECFTDDHRWWMMVVVAGYILVLCGIPAIFFLGLKKLRDGSEIHDEGVVAMLGFLYTGFRSECYFYECLLMLRKLAYGVISKVATLLGASPVATPILRSISLLVTTVLSLLMHYLLRPHDCRAYFLFRTTETALLVAVLMTILVNLWRVTSRPAFSYSSDDVDVSLDPQHIMFILELVVLFVVNGHYLFLTARGMLRPLLLNDSSFISMYDQRVVLVEGGLVLGTLRGSSKKLLAKTIHMLVNHHIVTYETFRYDRFAITMKHVFAMAFYWSEMHRLYPFKTYSEHQVILREMAEMEESSGAEYHEAVGPYAASRLQLVNLAKGITMGQKIVANLYSDISKWDDQYVFMISGNGTSVDAIYSEMVALLHAMRKSTIEFLREASGEVSGMDSEKPLSVEVEHPMRCFSTKVSQELDEGLLPLPGSARARRISRELRPASNEIGEFTDADVDQVIVECEAMHFKLRKAVQECRLAEMEAIKEKLELLHPHSSGRDSQDESCGSASKAKMEPAPQPFAEPLAEPFAEPATEPTAKFSGEHSSEPAAEPTEAVASAVESADGPVHLPVASNELREELRSKLQEAEAECSRLAEVLRQHEDKAKALQAEIEAEP